MNTKTLLLLGVFGAAGLTSAVAQTNVYSVNAVGYINVTVPQGFSLIANQLNTTNNSIASLFPVVPGGTQIFKYSNGVGFTAYTFDDLDNAWLPNGNATLNLGEGAFIKNNSASPFTLTFVGEVAVGSLTNSTPAGFSIQSSKVPLSGRVDTVLQLPGVAGDQVLKYVNGSGYVVSTFDDLDNTWLPSVPTIGVGEAFFLKKQSAGQWVRSFTVNN